MGKTFEVEVQVSKKKLSTVSGRALTRIASYDWVLFTSKNAVTFFVQELRERHISFPKDLAVGAVGPVTAQAASRQKWDVKVIPEQFTVNNLLRAMGDIQGKRILFPRSAIALHEAIRKLRARGARVTVLPLYTTEAMPLTQTAKRSILRGLYNQFKFKSPSGVKGFVGQFSPAERRYILAIPALCIGPTTAQAARTIGFKKIIRSKV